MTCLNRWLFICFYRSTYRSRICECAHIIICFELSFNLLLLLFLLLLHRFHSKFLMEKLEENMFDALLNCLTLKEHTVWGNFTRQTHPFYTFGAPFAVPGITPMLSLMDLSCLTGSRQTYFF